MICTERAAKLLCKARPNRSRDRNSHTPGAICATCCCNAYQPKSIVSIGFAGGSFVALKFQGVLLLSPLPLSNTKRPMYAKHLAYSPQLYSPKRLCTRV